MSPVNANEIGTGGKVVVVDVVVVGVLVVDVVTSSSTEVGLVPVVTFELATGVETIP